MTRAEIMKYIFKDGDFVTIGFTRDEISQMKQVTTTWFIYLQFHLENNPDNIIYLRLLKDDLLRFYESLDCMKITSSVNLFKFYEALALFGIRCGSWDYGGQYDLAKLEKDGIINPKEKPSILDIALGRGK